MLSFNLIRKDKWPLYAAAAVLVISVLVLGDHLLKATGGIFSLPRDESFFQLSIAKNLAFRRVWGIGRYDFAAASPSILYPLVLAVIFFIFGAHLTVVPAINTVIAIYLLVVVQRWLAKRNITSVNQLFILLAVNILSFLPGMVVYGMESPLLLLLTFLFVSRLIDEWQLTEFSRRTLIYGALMVASRYDGVLLVGSICLLLLWGRKWLRAFELTLWCLLPVLIFGYISLFKGGFFIPNQFILQSASPLISYDWLVGCATAIAVPSTRNVLVHRRQIKAMLVVSISVGVIILILVTTNLYAVKALDRNSLVTYKMNYPIAKFAHRYYYRNGIASDDIGMISFLADGGYLDLSGVASLKIARSKLDHLFSPGLVSRLSQELNARVAIVSDRYDKVLEDNWVRTASWELPGCGTMTFYAADSTDAFHLREHLDDYAPFLPRDITAQYFYTLPPEKKGS